MAMISICIPAYKNTVFLKRLLHSISIQTYTDYEVIVTDDSPDDEVKKLCDAYKKELPLQYWHNRMPLGTPENWNEAIRRARGAWIKIMHDDDWFRDAGSLQAFANAIDDNNGFIFSAYYNVYLSGSQKEYPVLLNKLRLQAMRKNAVSLFASNIIGPPSVVMYRNEGRVLFDPQLKWLVDIEFYIEKLAAEKLTYVEEPVINIGISERQVTTTSKGVRQVEIPESFYLFSKTGTHHLPNILIYDAWWRLLRNLDITDEQHIRDAGYKGEIHPSLRSMIRWQRRIPRFLLQVGPVSKLLMSVNYLLCNRLQ